MFKRKQGFKSAREAFEAGEMDEIRERFHENENGEIIVWVCLTAAVVLGGLAAYVFCQRLPKDRYSKDQLDKFADPFSFDPKLGNGMQPNNIASMYGGTPSHFSTPEEAYAYGHSLQLHSDNNLQALPGTLLDETSIS